MPETGLKEYIALIVETTKIVKDFWKKKKSDQKILLERMTDKLRQIVNRYAGRIDKRGEQQQPPEEGSLGEIVRLLLYPLQTKIPMMCGNTDSVAVIEKFISETM